MTPVAKGKERKKGRKKERKEGRAEILSKLIRMNSDRSFSCNIRLKLYCGSGKFSGSLNWESRRSSVSDWLPHPVCINRVRRCAEVECCFHKGCSSRKLDIHRGVSRGTVDPNDHLTQYTLVFSKHPPPGSAPGHCADTTAARGDPGRGGRSGWETAAAGPALSTQPTELPQREIGRAYV